MKPLASPPPGTDALPRQPGWISAASVQSPEDASFFAGAALAHLDLLARTEHLPAALCRDRLALAAAEACAGFTGRRETAACWGQRPSGGAGAWLPLRDAGGQPAAAFHRPAGRVRGACAPASRRHARGGRGGGGRKFGKGGPFDPRQKGQYTENAAVRGSAAPIDEEAIEITTLMADYVLSTLGRFPATVPAVFVNTIFRRIGSMPSSTTPISSPAPICAPMPSMTGTGG